MSDDIKNKLEGLLSGAERESLSRLAARADVKKMAQSLSDSDKKRLCEEFMKLDGAEIKRRLEAVDLSRLNGEDILKKLR